MKMTMNPTVLKEAMHAFVEYRCAGETPGTAIMHVQDMLALTDEEREEVQDALTVLPGEEQ